MPGLLDLPIELRECIYEDYLSLLRPTTFKIVRYPRSYDWTLITRKSRHAPTLLSVCRSISAEFQRVMSAMLAVPLGSIPLSRGPTITIDSRYSGRSDGDLSESTGEVEEDERVDEILRQILLNSAPSLRLQLVMPQSPADSLLFKALLNFICAICNARFKCLRHVRAIRDPVSGPGWTADVDGISDELDKIRCTSLEKANWYRPWYGRDTNAAVERASRDVVGATEQPPRQMSIDEAWQDVLETCRKYEEGMRQFDDPR